VRRQRLASLVGIGSSGELRPQRLAIPQTVKPGPKEVDTTTPEQLEGPRSRCYLASKMAPGCVGVPARRPSKTWRDSGMSACCRTPVEASSLTALGGAARAPFRRVRPARLGLLSERCAYARWLKWWRKASGAGRGPRGQIASPWSVMEGKEDPAVGCDRAAAAWTAGHGRTGRTSGYHR